MNRLAFIPLLFAATAMAQWSAPVHVLHEMKPCVTYRAKLSGDVLVVHAALQPGWKTFTIDNERRATEKLAGKPSLGIDQPTRITLTGLEVTGPWYQSAPTDYSKPQLRWFTWGYEREATFASKVRRLGAGGAQLEIRGQACTETTCKNIDVTLPLPADAREDAPFDLKTLILVR